MRGVDGSPEVGEVGCCVCICVCGSGQEGVLYMCMKEISNPRYLRW